MNVTQLNRRRLLQTGAIVGATFGAPVFADSKVEQGKYLFWLQSHERNSIERTGGHLIRKLDFAVVERDTLDGVSLDASDQLARLSSFDFRKLFERIRVPLGTPVDRQFEGISGGYLRLPNLRAGRYAIATWDVLFDGQHEIHTEQLTLEQAPGGRSEGAWLLTGYYISPKPYFEY